VEAVANQLQAAAAEAILKIAMPAPGSEERRALSRLGPPDMIEDLPSIAWLLQAREAIDALSNKLPSYI